MGRPKSAIEFRLGRKGRGFGSTKNILYYFSPGQQYVFLLGFVQPVGPISSECYPPPPITCNGQKVYPTCALVDKCNGDVTCMCKQLGFN